MRLSDSGASDFTASAGWLDKILKCIEFSVRDAWLI